MCTGLSGGTEHVAAGAVLLLLFTAAADTTRHVVSHTAQPGRCHALLVLVLLGVLLFLLFRLCALFLWQACQEVAKSHTCSLAAVVMLHGPCSSREVVCQDSVCFPASPHRLRALSCHSAWTADEKTSLSGLCQVAPTLKLSGPSHSEFTSLLQGVGHKHTSRHIARITTRDLLLLLFLL